eukprot:GAHX01001867.1.p1 GENE.GAHX01001867.1~~GAHX01001867.1.p1  ORF type:complete len:296 (-),score=39.84 GAHX01001867.1:154-1041(-)
MFLIFLLVSLGVYNSPFYETSPVEMLIIGMGSADPPGSANSRFGIYITFGFKPRSWEFHSSQETIEICGSQSCITSIGICIHFLFHTIDEFSGVFGTTAYSQLPPMNLQMQLKMLEFIRNNPSRYTIDVDFFKTEHGTELHEAFENSAEGDDDNLNKQKFKFFWKGNQDPVFSVKGVHFVPSTGGALEIGSGEVISPGSSSEPIIVREIILEHEGDSLFSLPIEDSDCMFGIKLLILVFCNPPYYNAVYCFIFQQLASLRTPCPSLSELRIERKQKLTETLVKLFLLIRSFFSRE